MVNFDNEVKIKIILECAIYTPSARNSQPWFFTVIKNKDLQKMSL